MNRKGSGADSPIVYVRSPTRRASRRQAVGGTRHQLHPPAVTPTGWRVDLIGHSRAHPLELASRCGAPRDSESFTPWASWYRSSRSAGERAPERRDPRVDFPALGDPRGRTLRRGGPVVTAAAQPLDAGRVSADALASAGDRRDRQCPLLVPFVLVHGSVRVLLAEQAGWIGLRFLVRILVGYGYVSLLERIQVQLAASEGVAGRSRETPNGSSSGMDGRAVERRMLPTARGC